MNKESLFINNILTPIQRDPFEMMHLLQASEIGSYEHFDTYDMVIPILGVEMYLDIERNKEENRQELLGGIDTSEDSEESLIGECEHIHNKVIFDCVNESLN